MVCRGHAPTFEEYVKKRLPARSEAGKLVATLSKDTSISNAIALAIESLSTRASRELRQIVDSFEDHCRWVENWEAKGWRMRVDGDWITLSPPSDFAWGYGKKPKDQVIAAGAGVRAVKFDDVSFEPKLEVTFRVLR